MRLLLPSLFVLSLPALAATQLTLPDGRDVVLEDDFSWHYLLTTPAQSGVAPRLSQQAMAEPALLSQSTSQGVTVTLVAQRQESDRVRLQLQVRNQQAGSVVQVEGQVVFYSEQGEQFQAVPLRLWQSIYQMPDTYLRQGDDKPFTTDWLALPAGQTHPLLQLQITEVKRRS